MDSVGEKIRIQRLTKNFSQEYMAFMLDISQPAYSKIERGETEITLQKVWDIAEILEISPYILMPKPKYGTGINHEWVVKTFRKLRKFWSANMKQRKLLYFSQLPAGHSDTSNISGK